MIDRNFFFGYGVGVAAVLITQVVIDLVFP